MIKFINIYEPLNIIWEKVLKIKELLKREKENLTLSSKANPETLESVMIFNQKEISPDLSDGLNILPSKDKKEFFCQG